MRSSIVLVSLMGALVVATPLRNPFAKRAVVTDVVVETVYITVTAGQVPTTSSKKHHTHTVHHTVVVPFSTSTSTATSSTSIAPPPAPASTTTPEPEPTSTPAPQPAAETTTEPAPVPTTTSEAAIIIPTVAAAPVVPTTAAAPVVEAPAALAAAPSDYASTAVYHHTMHRANHSAPAVTWDDTLAGYALASAKKCVFAHDMTQGNRGYGQNLAAYGSSGDLSKLDLSNLVADAITNQWYYGEAANVIYDQDSPNISGPEFLHFTQVIWKASTKIGCATVQCPAGSIFGMASLYTVCDYASQGNVLGAFISEVSKPLNLASISASIQ